MPQDPTNITNWFDFSPTEAMIKEETDWLFKALRSLNDPKIKEYLDEKTD